MDPLNLFLFSLSSLIWGSTWIVIVFQLPYASPFSLIFFRFLIASSLLFSILIFKKKKLMFSIDDHKFFIAQGIFNFSINYILTYLAEQKISSGLVALIFTLIVHFNLMGMIFIYNEKLKLKNATGAFLSFIGMLLIFKDDISQIKLNGNQFIGIALSVIATLSASIGNMFFIQIKKRNISVMSSNAWGMFYGTICTGILGLIFSDSFQFEMNWTVAWTLGYLSIVGTIIAFGSYMTLIKNIGAENAAYTSIASPIIALTISYFFENIRIVPSMLIGAGLCILGNLVALSKTKKVSR